MAVCVQALGAAPDQSSSGSSAQTSAGHRQQVLRPCAASPTPTRVNYLTPSLLLSFADFERSGRFQDWPDAAPVLSLLSRLGDAAPRLTHGARRLLKGRVASPRWSAVARGGYAYRPVHEPHLYSYRARGAPTEIPSRLGVRPASDHLKRQMDASSGWLGERTGDI
jgi:hypothetical protein